ncbi:MAG: CDP-archaeol synthase [Chloroflexota bacterium]
MLKQRLLVALFGLPILAVIIWFGEPWYTILAVIWGLVCTFEFYGMVTRLKIKPLTILGLLFSPLFITSSHFSHSIIYLPLILTTVVVLPLTLLLLQPKKEGAYSRWVWMVAGIIYISWLLHYLVAIRNGHTPLAISSIDSRNWIYYIFATTFISDTLAFFLGRAIGKHHLAPQVSPHKTWEGSLAGLFGATLTSLLFTLPTPLALPLTCFQAVLLGLAVSIFGQTGDLVKSLLKRNMGVKDSSNFLPGHGGFLDRIDSVLFAGVIVYYYVLFAAQMS